MTGHTTNEPRVRDLVEDDRIQTYTGSNTYLDMMADLLAGRIEGFLLDKPYALQVLDEFPNERSRLKTVELTEEIDSRFALEKIGFAVRRDDALLRAMNEALHSVSERRRSLEEEFLGHL